MGQCFLCFCTSLDEREGWSEIAFLRFLLMYRACYTLFQARSELPLALCRVMMAGETRLLAGASRVMAAMLAPGSAAPPTTGPGASGPQHPPLRTKRCASGLFLYSCTNPAPGHCITVIPTNGITQDVS